MRTVASERGVAPGQHSFAQVPGSDIERSVFNRSHNLKNTFNAGLLVPVLCDEALPGDTMNLRMSSFVRMTTPKVPVMDNMYMDVFFFAVPMRLLWSNWQKFNGEQDNPGDPTDFLCPQFQDVIVAEESLSDYIGLPLAPLGSEISFNSFWHRAYNLIWNEWFRDENLQDKVVVDLDDGPDNLADYVLLRRGKRHDYFSSSLPFRQKGDPVTLPLGEARIATRAAVGTDVAVFGTTGSQWRKLDSNAANVDLSSATGIEADQLYADLNETIATVSDLRAAFQAQRLLERDARGGTRYTEILRSHFGVISPDQRLQRPEYLGGGSTRINIHPVAATTALSQPLGELGGFATAGVDGVGFMKSFTEHCVVLGLVNVRADITYQQGIERQFLRQTRSDFFWPAFAHLGEQTVQNMEIFADGTNNDLLPWGYQERYAEYRYKPSRTASAMRSTHSAPLDVWHLALDFDVRPALNDSFIQDQPPMARVLVTGSTEQEFYGDFSFGIRHARPMPTFSVPGLIDHF